MIHLHPSNRIERLVDGLATWLAQPRVDAFSTDLVVINSKGLERWLAMQLAERWGVCADVQFVFPGPALESAISDVLGDEASDAWSAGHLTWTIAQVLPKLLKKPAFAPLRAWVDASGVEPADATIRLASRLAPVFEPYPTWRPDEVRRWRNKPEKDWTSQLWHALAAAIEVPNLAERAQTFLGAIAKGKKPRTLPDRVALFAPGALAPLHVDLFAALGRVREVHLFALSPSPSTVHSHPLLASLARSHGDAQVRFAIVAASVEPAYADPATTTLLGALQADLLHDRPLETPVPRTVDRSLSIHACPGAVREIEVLREELVRRLDEDPTLEPRDLAILTPDVDTYAPLVAAVFGDGAPTLVQARTHPTGMPAIQFAIGDRGPASENPVASALLAVLGALLIDRFDAPTVVDLLARAPIREKFGLAEDALASVRTWVQDSGVRWGIDEAHREAHGQVKNDRFTWRFGLDRLLLGTAVSSEATVLDRLPIGAVSNKDERQVLGALADFADVLFDAARDSERPRLIREWVATLRALVTRTLDDGSWHVHVVQTALQDLATAAEGYDAPVSLGTVRGLLEGGFSVHAPGRAFLSGGATVSQLTPLRAIPFRIVAMVGMNDGAFPRVPNLPSFDLLAQVRPGDRNPREDDRGLFLDTILAARDALIITYSGRDPTDGSLRPPAVPVGELLDAIGQAFGADARKAVETKHPLRPFDPRLFDANAPAHADVRHLAAAKALAHARRNPPAPMPATRPFALPAVEPQPLKLSELASFIRDPIARTLARRLRLWFRDDDAILDDREPLRVQPGLGNWAVRDAALQRRLAGLTDAKELGRLEAREARVPRGTRGMVDFRKADDDAQKLAVESKARLGAPLPPRDLVIDVRGRTLHGRVARIGSGGHLRVQAGRLNNEQLLVAWVWHLALQASGDAVQTWVVAKDSTTCLGPLAAAEAAGHLHTLTLLHEAGQRGPVPLFASASRLWAELSPTPDASTDAQAAAKLAASWGPTATDALVLGDLAPWEPEAAPLWVTGTIGFADLARAVWLPLLAALEDL